MLINTISLTLDQFVGNEPIKNIINDNITIAKKKQSAFPHTIIFGQSGSGKSSLVHAIAKSMGVKCIELNCASGNRETISTIVMKAPNNAIVFLDEIHSLPVASMEQTLYRFMDEGVIHIKYPDGDIEVFKIPNNLTIIGATTEIDKIPPPLMNRFTLQLKLKNYTHDEMVKILTLHLKHTPMDDDAYNTLANATRYVPRMAVQFARKISDYALQFDLTYISNNDVLKALNSWGIDKHGLTDDDREYISLLYTTFNNNPTGIKQLCAMLGDSEANIIQCETHLVREGLLRRSSRGRILSASGLMLAMSICNTT